MAAIITAETLVCRTCGREQDEGEFWGQSSKSNGKQSECKTCMRSRNRRWFKANASPELAAALRENVNRTRRNKPVMAMIRFARYRAKKAGIEFSITADDIDVPEFCPILGIKLEFGLGRCDGSGWQGKENSPSIDRIDNTKGYTRDNVIIVSFRANRLKSDATAAELMKLALFYEGMINEPIRSAIPARDQAEGQQTGQPEDALSEVQPYSEKQKGPMPVGDHRGR